eukprot:25784-Amphidinium_carterae.1
MGQKFVLLLEPLVWHGCQLSYGTEGFGSSHLEPSSLGQGPSVWSGSSKAGSQGLDSLEAARASLADPLLCGHDDVHAPLLSEATGIGSGLVAHGGDLHETWRAFPFGTLGC